MKSNGQDGSLAQALQPFVIYLRCVCIRSIENLLTEITKSLTKERMDRNNTMATFDYWQIARGQLSNVFCLRFLDF